MARVEQHRQSDRTKRRGLVSRTISFVIGLPVTVLVTMIFSILVEWVVMHNYYPELGAGHSKQMLQEEARYLNSHFKKSLLGTKPVLLAGETIQWVDRNIFRPIGIEGYKNRSRQERGWAWKYVVSAYNMVKLVLLRLCVLVMSLPAYVLFAVVGLVTGLVERDLRKFGAGHESSDRFELAVKAVGPSVIVCFIVYMSWPDSINPAMIIVPFAALFGFALFLATSNYKKRF